MIIRAGLRIALAAALIGANAKRQPTFRFECNAPGCSSGEVGGWTTP